MWTKPSAPRVFRGEMKKLYAAHSRCKWILRDEQMHRLEWLMAFPEMGKDGKWKVVWSRFCQKLSIFPVCRGKKWDEFSRGWGEMVCLYHYLVLSVAEKKKTELRLCPNTSAECPCLGKCCAKMTVSETEITTAAPLCCGCLKNGCIRMTVGTAPSKCHEDALCPLRHEGTKTSWYVTLCAHSPLRLWSVCIKSLTQPSCQGKSKHRVLKQRVSRRKRLPEGERSGPGD